MLQSTKQIDLCRKTFRG